jgi:hypothetical protein
LNNCLNLARSTSGSALPRPTRLDWKTLRCTATNIEAAVAAFIRSTDITRCPTAGGAADPVTPGAADRVALQRYAAPHSQSRRQQPEARDQSFLAAKVLAGPGN